MFQLLLHTGIAKAGRMMRLWALQKKTSEDALSLALCLEPITVFPPPQLDSGVWLGPIHSLLTLLVGAELREAHCESLAL